MNRKNFLTTSAFGLSLLSVPAITLSSSQRNNKKEPMQPFYVPPREPLKPGISNQDIRTIIHADQTDMQFSNVEVSLAPKQMGPSPHMHADLDELMYVLEGRATVMVGEKIYEVETGGWQFRPRRIVHSFWNSSDKPLRFVDCFFNQNFEDYLEELIHKIIPEMIRNNLNLTSPEIASRIAALDKKFGVTWFHDQRQAIIDKYNLLG